MSKEYQKIVVSGFLHHQGKVLVIQRSLDETFLPGFFELPGGKVDFGEDPSDALKREFREEVSLDVSVIGPYRTFSYVSDEGRRHTVEIVYFVQLDSNEITLRLSPAHISYRWVNLEDLDQLQASNEIKQNIRIGFEQLPIRNHR
ncbi:NUDIX domain-containing protein [Thermoactinomyces sp. CICC 23799]|uniref:NUDIX domain-containing protein n=1 Tax=Thermoactinomyces sp. CICC 23799 TaxID=2767429 RepID=UPI0018DE1FD2|nr:NUDIX domain-containing protein [Thermoactinomyces sp. CICC 23799]MBH8601382.1 NUDIX domain-containing protein [Thermoactinomyces sp. CICC 23799]